MFFCDFIPFISKGFKMYFIVTFGLTNKGTTFSVSFSDSSKTKNDNIYNKTKQQQQKNPNT